MFLYDFLLRVTPPKKKKTPLCKFRCSFLVGPWPLKKRCTSHILKGRICIYRLTCDDCILGLGFGRSKSSRWTFCLVVESQAKPFVISCHDCILWGVLLIQINPNLSPSPTTFFFDRPKCSCQTFFALPCICIALVDLRMVDNACDNFTFWAALMVHAFMVNQGLGRNPEIVPIWRMGPHLGYMFS